MPRPTDIHTLAAVVLILCLSRVGIAEVTLPAVFVDNMVLQHGQANPVWGKAESGETIEVTIAGHCATAVTAASGRWQVTLPEMPVHREPLEMHVHGSSGSDITVENILVGEVWLCTGPSNIFWPVRSCDNAKEEIAAAKYPHIRFFTVKKATADEPQEDCSGDWFPCNPRTVGDVSGIGYFFARSIHQDQNVPIGVLQSFWGGSRVEAWTSSEALEAEAAVAPILRWWEDEIRQFDSAAADAEFATTLARWKLAAAKAKQLGKKPSRKPRKPLAPSQSQHRPAALYIGMIAPLIPYGIRGVISYQGLGNLYWADYNRVLLGTLIRDWRSRWNQGPFPFGMVQPAPYPCDGRPAHAENAYAVQRESQLLVLGDVPNTGVAPTMDIGDLDELHFTNKQAVAQRLAAWALATVYDRDVPHAGPIYESMTVEGDKIRIHFRHTAAGLSTSDNRPPAHFTIAGSDKQFHAAKATIDGHTVIVHSPQVPSPTAVRFAWSDTAVPNLINSDNLPASLFRTDAPQ